MQTGYFGKGAFEYLQHRVNGLTFAVLTGYGHIRAYKVIKGTRYGEAGLLTQHRYSDMCRSCRQTSRFVL